MPRSRNRSGPSNQKAAPRPNSSLIILGIILLSIFLTLAFYYGPSPINGSDNYIYQSTAQAIATQGFKNGLGDPGTLGVKFILVTGNALFYKLMGVSNLSSEMFDMLCGSLLLIVIYLIGSELHSKRAGLISAFVFSFFPLFILQSSNGPGDDIPMALFASFAILLYILGSKHRRPSLFAASGFVAAMGFLIVAEASLIALPILLFLIYDTARNWKNAKWLALFVSGIVVGLVFIAFLSFLQTGSPLYVFHTDSNWYSNFCQEGGSCTPLGSFDSLDSYLSMMMPYGISGQIWGSGATANAASNILNDLTSSNTASGYGMTFGFYFYLAIFFAIVLGFFADRRAAVPLVWMISTLLYLSFGTMSISQFVSVQPVYARVTLLFGPAIALIIGFGIEDILKAAKSKDASPQSRKARVYIAYAFAAVVLGFLLVQSVISIRYQNYAEYNYIYPLIQAGQYINTLQQNATIVGSLNYPVLAYSRYLNPFYATNGQTCEGVKPGWYIYSPLNSTLEQLCNMTIVSGPYTAPSWLPNYSTYTTFGGISNMVIYRRNQ